MRPDAMASTSPNAARGLMQVVGVVRQDYNQRNGTAYTADDLLNPEINVKLAAAVLNQIVTAYGKHPSPNMRENWGNPEYVKLVTAGWNGGYSESAGVGKVASYLEQRGMPVTHDSVYANAAAAGGVVYLQLDGRRAWQRSVSDLYFAQPDAGGGSLMTFLGLAALAWGAYKLSS